MCISNNQTYDSGLLWFLIYMYTYQAWGFVWFPSNFKTYQKMLMYFQLWKIPPNFPYLCVKIFSGKNQEFTNFPLYKSWEKCDANFLNSTGYMCAVYVHNISSTGDENGSMLGWLPWWYSGDPRRVLGVEWRMLRDVKCLITQWARDTKTINNFNYTLQV